MHLKCARTVRIAALLCAYVILALEQRALAADTSAYSINDRVVVHTPDGARISAIVVRLRGAASRRPTAFYFTIYADPAADIRRLEYAADRGYAGVVANTRGKTYSPGRIIPYEDDGRDANVVVDWIARQPWSDGQVGMFGGSYNGFTQWAAAKYANPHLKTIVPEVPNNPGNGLPMQNSIFLPVNYAWVYYVTSDKFLDDAAYNDQRFQGLPFLWYRSGRAYRDIDAVAGVPNPWLHKWLEHPSYDAYWQAMGPYRSDYARITIPVLTIDGYYGDSTAIGYFGDFARYNASAKNYLVAGPWDHFGTQQRVKPPVLRGYRIDPVAHIDPAKLTFDWFDYVMRGKGRPALVRDRVNYEVMGENRWRHTASLDAMGAPQRFYLSAQRVSRRFYLLAREQQPRAAALRERVDLGDRNVAYNNSYPGVILGKKLSFSTGYAFVTQPFATPAEVGGFDGSVHLRVNKRDLDVGLALYELLPDGRLFELSYFTQRASYAADMSTRHLLTPGAEATVPFVQGYLFSRWVRKGSRLLLTVDVNVNPFAEIDYGTGKDVSTESIRDAGKPMEIDWLTSSYVRVRIKSV
jgi:putative CocE/NonD family hydrolase